MYAYVDRKSQQRQENDRAKYGGDYAQEALLGIMLADINTQPVIYSTSIKPWKTYASERKAQQQRFSILIQPLKQFDRIPLPPQLYHTS